MEATFILEKRYNNCGIVTWEVYGELSSGFAKYPALKYVDRMIDDKTFRLSTLSPDARKKYTGLIGQLGKGEASCIAAAKTRSGIAVTDDRAARMVCQRLEVPVTGTVGILKASVLIGAKENEIAVAVEGAG